MNENTPVLRWEDADRYLQARQEIRAQRDWLGPDTSSPVVAHVDEHRVAVLNRTAIEPFGDVLAVEADRAYRERQENARTRIRLAEALDETPSDEDLRLVKTPSGQAQVDAILAKRAKNRQMAVSEAKRAIRGQHDGSHVELYEGDPHGWAFEAERTRSAVPQIALHQAMAEGKPVKRWWQK